MNPRRGIPQPNLPRRNPAKMVFPRELSEEALEVLAGEVLAR